MTAVKIKRALLSVSDKNGLIDLARFLVGHGVELLSTGGSAKAIRDAGLEVRDVSDYTGHPEMMGGRVKTLHPKIHGGLLGIRGNAEHEKAMKQHGIDPIDLVVVNLYPFEETVAQGKDFAACIENIDIGGPSMLRSSAKNHASVVICTSPAQYPELMSTITEHGGTPLLLRKRFAAAAFSLSAAYDSAIASWFARQLDDEEQGEQSAVVAAPTVVTRMYKPEFPLKYGCNPYQTTAGIYSIAGRPPAFSVLNGSPGYINLMDAMNAYQLVTEARYALGMPAATSFKHVSPAGAAVAVPLTPALEAAYEAAGVAMTPLALAYLRARNADPLCSFGDFVAVSDVVDEATANILRREVSDGIIAPGYTPAALEILSKKKSGKFVVLKGTEGFEPPPVEYREIYGVTFMQQRNTKRFDQSCLQKIATASGTAASGAAGSDALPTGAQRDLILASITLKYTQSNSIAYALDGQVIGVGAGQQSRVDCVKLAGRKVSTWYLRQHPKVLAMEFLPGVKRQDRVNARVRYIEGDFTPTELTRWNANFASPPPPLTEEEKAQFLGTLSGVSLSSDAFFPFRDSIDHASKYGVKYIVQPGGSVGDEEAIGACQEYGMTMAFSNMRLFHH